MGILASPAMAAPPPPPPLPPAANPPVFGGSESVGVGAAARARALAQGGTPGGEFGVGQGAITGTPVAGKALVGAGT
jgi:hypothetical protein